MEEAKRCELKLPVEIQRTAHIRCGGHVPTRAIASRNRQEGERPYSRAKVSAHSRHEAERLQ
jgi:hypothetical protein